MHSLNSGSELRSTSQRETAAAADALAEKLRPGDWVLLWGPMGSGKTLFVQALARALAVAEAHQVDSPTFTLWNHYPGGVGMDHLDLFRLGEGLGERLGAAQALDFLPLEELLGSSTIKCVEWPELLSPWFACMRGWHVKFSWFRDEPEARILRFAAQEGEHAS
jgi:tRNA threonylcarbamoyl adenosine modification protein YjeE